MNMFDWIRTTTTIYKNGKLVGRGDISGSGWWVVPGCKARMENGDVIEVRVVIEIGGKEYTFVVNEVREYPDDNKEYHTMKIRNHWNFRDRVVIEIGGKEYTFVAEHIEKALRNATNAH